MIFDKTTHKWTLQSVFGFSFVFNGFKVGVYKVPGFKTWDAALLGYGVIFGMTEKSKKAAIYNAIDTLKKCNFSPSKMGDTAARFASVAAECNIDISDQIKPPTEPETPADTVVTPVESPTPADTVVTPVESPTEPETVVAPRNVCSFTPLSPGERHAAAITTENAAPPLMVVIWLYFAVLQKRLFSVSHTLERCHVPVYGFTRLLYTVVSLLLYHADVSGLLPGLPLFVVSNFKRDHVDTFPCTCSGLSSLRVLCGIETVSGLTRLTGCRTCYHDTS
jgi:hypothetical protein